MQKKRLIASVMESAGAAAGLVVMWQAVRFCKGEIGAPFVDWYFRRLTEFFGGPLDPESPITWLSTGIHYLLGVTVWCWLGLLVLAIMRDGARIYMVGYKQYREEARAAAEEERRLARIEAARERRRELRRRASGEKSGLSVTSIVLGVIIGSIFF
ncbi:TPA: hypothetical protein ACK3Q6_008060 [Burkholderia cepacia]